MSLYPNGIINTDPAAAQQPGWRPPMAPGARPSSNDMAEAIRYAMANTQPVPMLSSRQARLSPSQMSELLQRYADQLMGGPMLPGMTPSPGAAHPPGLLQQAYERMSAEQRANRQAQIDQQREFREQRQRERRRSTEDRYVRIGDRTVVERTVAYRVRVSHAEVMRRRPNTSYSPPLEAIGREHIERNLGVTAARLAVFVDDRFDLDTYSYDVLFELPEDLVKARQQPQPEPPQPSSTPFERPAAGKRLIKLPKPG